jgi:hypothetical protein
LTSASLQEAKNEYIMAILYSLSWEPENKKFFLPSGQKNQAQKWPEIPEEQSLK